MNSVLRLLRGSRFGFGMHADVMIGERGVERLALERRHVAADAAVGRVDGQIEPRTAVGRRLRSAVERPSSRRRVRRSGRSGIGHCKCSGDRSVSWCGSWQVMQSNEPVLSV